MLFFIFSRDQRKLVLKFTQWRKYSSSILNVFVQKLCFRNFVRSMKSNIVLKIGWSCFCECCWATFLMAPALQHCWYKMIISLRWSRRDLCWVPASWLVWRRWRRPLGGSPKRRRETLGPRLAWRVLISTGRPQYNTLSSVIYLELYCVFFCSLTMVHKNEKKNFPSPLEKSCVRPWFGAFLKSSVRIQGSSRSGLRFLPWSGYSEYRSEAAWALTFPRFSDVFSSTWTTTRRTGWRRSWSGWPVS